MANIHDFYSRLHLSEGIFRRQLDQNHFKYDCATENPRVTKSCSLLVRCRRTYVLNKHDMFMQYEKFSA